MASEQILRIARSDSEGDYILVNVASNGASALDLKLLATEGESPYILDMKQSRVHKFRAKTSHQDEAQWESILRSILLRQPLVKNSAETNSFEQLEVRANIAGDRLAIIVRKNISGIIQRLGEILLRKDESQEIDSISWTATAVMRSTTLEKQMEDLREKYDEQSRTVETLNQQLEDLIVAKLEHENALLKKFQDLLNAKKLKIRDQQRLLASAKVDPAKAARIQSARSTSIPRSPSKRAAKRKANHPPSARYSNSEDDNAFDEMSVDQDDNILPTATPDRSENSETEDEDDDNLDSAPIFQPIKEPILEKPSMEHGAERPAQDRSLPPRRELPFLAQQSTTKADGKDSQDARKAVLHGEASTGNKDDDDDDETSDDEL